MLKRERSPIIALAAATMIFLLLGVPEAGAQTTDCKHCTVTCTNQSGYYTCYESCIRMSIDDCRNYNLQCAGVCYTYLEGETYRCRLMSDYYPCYA